MICRDVTLHYINKQRYTHTCNHTYELTYIHTNIHTYKHTYKHTNKQTYIHAYKHTHTNNHTCINTYAHLYVYIHMDFGIRNLNYRVLEPSGYSEPSFQATPAFDLLEPRSHRGFDAEETTKVNVSIPLETQSVLLWGSS